MPNPTLFPLDEPFTPSLNRQEPALWLTRLVILPDFGATNPIREIPFRRGLNIIQTRQRTPRETQVVGHSVGKTLLMRLIRYTLGEHHFAVKHVRSRIANEFRTALVIAHWKVAGEDWIVVRPLQEARSSKSFAVKADNWRDAIQEGQVNLPFSEFLAAVNQSALSGLTEFTLPRARRSPKWLDVLGWVARDVECGYRAPNEWRHDDADSGPGLDRDDNSVTLQWLAGLMGSEEIALKHAHQKLLDERQTVKSSRETAQRTVDVTGPSLFSKLQLPSEEQVAEDAEGLFAVQIEKKAEDKMASLTRLKKDRFDQSPTAKLDAAEEAARTELTNAIAEVLAVAKQIKFLKGRLEQLEKSDSTSLYLVRSPYENCPAPVCPMRVANRPAPQVDPARDHQLSSLREEVAEQSRELTTQQQIQETRKEELTEATKQAKQEKDRLQNETSGIDQEVGRWQGYQNDAQSYRRARKELSEASQSLEALDQQIDESYKAQESVRQGLLDRLGRLSRCYARILREVFGQDADGAIVLDGKGLHPRPDNRLAPNGAALSIMTTVLAFDIASMAASAIGVGHHPRLLIHDSPREGDMEEPLFHQLFHVVRNLEMLFAGKEPSFQYIVTTTTAPPEELGDEAGPFVRLTLDARNPADHLLGVCF